MVLKTLQKIDIFISSPGDVEEEKKIALKVISELNSRPSISDKLALRALEHKKDVPAVIGSAPQKTCDLYMNKTDQADILICIMCSRMGTPVIDEETDKEYQSGTEYEFITAYDANQRSGKPLILLYHGMKENLEGADSKQVKRVQDFFKRFEGKDADFKGHPTEYKSNNDFENILRRDLDRIITKNFPSGSNVYYDPPAIPNYPNKLKEFVTENRADELTNALMYLQDHRILLISGIGGVGKTTLARALIETRPANVPLPFWFDFSKKMDVTLGDILEKLASYMKAPRITGFRAERREAGQDDINILTGELQKREQLWLVFDNLEIILNEDKKFRDEGLDLLFTSLRGSTHKAKIIITSRVLSLLKTGDNLIDALDEKQELKGLKSNFAVDFLVKNGLEAVERNKLEELVTGVDGHPLALRLLIELVKKFGVSDTLNDLSRYQRHKEDTIKKARRLFEKLAGDEKKLLENISVFRKPETMAAIKAMFTERTSEDAVEKLIDKSLLETNHKGSYWLHPLIREFSYADLKTKKEIHQLAFSYYISLKLPEKRTKKDDVQSLIEACYHAWMAEEYDKAASIIFDKKLFEDLDRWGEARTLIDLYTGLLPEDHFSDNVLLRDKKTHGAVLENLGNAYSDLGQVEKAIQYYQKALDIAQEIGDRTGERARLGNLGNAYLQLGQVKKASEHYQIVLDMAQDIGDRRNEGNALGNLGNAYYSLGRSHISWILNWDNNIGNAYNETEQVEKVIQYYQKAIQCYQNALAIFQEIGDRRAEGVHLGNMGNAYRDLREGEKSIEHYKKALDIAQEIGDRRAEGAHLGNMGNAYRDLSEGEKSIEHYKKALEIAQEIGDRRAEGTWLNSLGLDFQNEKKYKEALACYILTKKIHIELKDPDLKTIESNINNLKEELGENDFEKLINEVESVAEEIVKKLLG